MSFLAQVVQIGAAPALFAIELSEAHADALTIGAIAAAPWIAILLLGHLAPRILVLWGLVATSAIGVALSTLALMAALLQPCTPLLFGVNFLFGIGLILRWVACDTWIIAVAPEAIRGRAIGVHETLMGCAIAAAPVVLLLAGTSGPSPLIACIVLLSGSGLCLMTLSRQADPTPPPPPRRGTLDAFRALPTAIASGFAAGYAETAYISFLPVFAGRGDLIVGPTIALGAFGTGGALLQIPLGWAADRYGYRALQRLCALSVALGTFIGAYATQTAPTLILLLFMLGGAAGGLNTLAVIEAGRRASASSVANAMVAVAIAYTIGGAAGPIIAGWASGLRQLPGFASAIALGAAAYLLASVLFRPVRAAGCGSG